MSDVTYRDATPADAVLMSELGPRTFVETFGHLYTPDNLAAFLKNHSEAEWRTELEDPRYKVRLAETGGEAIGFVKYGPPSLPFEPNGPSGELRQLYVLGPWQGQGVAQALMDWVIDEARGRGAVELYLSVFEDNERAQRFYARYGFEPVGLYDFMVGDHRDVDIVMRLKL
jgi:ribosomal protein S18 acetylase RimI-like enzyme